MVNRGRREIGSADASKRIANLAADKAIDA
jgi:hypothetical protein